MWGWNRPTKESLQGHKWVKIRGQWFKIRRINPLMDFPSGKMPQIFSSTPPGIKTRLDNPPADLAKKYQEDMYAVIEAGVLDPQIVPVSKREDGITAEDVFRIPEVGIELYMEIIEHSLLRMRGLSRIFFWLARTRLRYTLWRLGMGGLHMKSLFRERVSA